MVLSCSLILALSGCSSKIEMANQNAATNSGQPDSVETAALSGFSCSHTTMTGSGTDACTVTVDAPAASGGLIVNLSTNNAALTVPASVTVPADATSAGFSATVSPVAASQKVTLTASAGSVSETFAVQLNAATPTLSVATSGSPSSYGSAVTLTATISNGLTGPVTFYDGGVSIGTGVLNGTMATLTTALLAAGTHTITANWPGNSNYEAVTSAAITQLVSAATPAISWTAPAAIAYGTALSATQLDATSSVAGTFAYSPAAGTVLKAGSQTLSVTFTPTDSTDYATAKATVTLAVDKDTPTIKWATPAAIGYGTALSATQLDATSSAAGTFAYSPAAGTVLKAGSQTLSVTFTPTDSTDYLTAKATVTLAVDKDTPTITWATPAAIGYGTALSATQLDASSTVAGTFAYSPAAGTLLKAGTQTLSVTFTPTDSTDYSTAKATVTLAVDKATPTIKWDNPAAIIYGTALSAAQLDASSTVAGTFVYSPAAGNLLKAGTQTLSVTFTPTDTTDYSTAKATVTLAVDKATPTIRWDNPAAIAFGTALSSTQLNAGSAVDGTFAYSPAAGTVLKAGTQTLSVTFTPTNSADYTTAKATVTLTVDKAAPTIKWTNPAAIAYGTALSSTQLNAGSAVDGAFAYSPAAGTVLKAGTQTLSVTFTPIDSADYTTAKATVDLAVDKAKPTIQWAKPAAITYGTALSAAQLDANSTVAGTFVYSPAAGTVLKAGLQTLSVTFTPTDSADYATTTATVGLTVNTLPSTITWAMPAAITYGTALSAAQLDATSSVAGTFAYTPSAGTVLKAGAQTLSVTFTPTDSTAYSTTTASVALSVKQATPTITWNAPSAITYGTALSATQLDASSTEAGTFSYSPAAGTVLKAGAQSLSVTFTPTDTTDYTTATATVTLTVKQTTPIISWTAPAAIAYGTALSATQLDATSSVAGTFAYTPAAGTVLKAGAQTLSVTFTPTDLTDYSSATATVTLTVKQSTPLISWTAPAAIAYGTALSATQLDASSTVAGTFSYSPAAGTVLKAGLQSLSVTFTPTDSTDYTTATANVTLTVNTLPNTITWATPATITYGTALSATQLDASSTVAGTFSYSPAAGTVLKAGAQTLSVTFTPTDSTDYSTATATVTLTVKQASSTITWTAPSAIAYGTALTATQLNATSTVAGTFAYTPAAGTVLKAGAQTLSVTFTPTDSTDYSTVTATVSITVNAATSNISWAAPAAINYGTALTAAQLNATSTVAGTFAYTPAAGAVLKAGAQSLSVTFTPTDSTDYSTSTATITLTVKQATPTITWTAPSAIAYGTALSATQLDASSTVAGTFSYSPAAGTVLKAGAQTLSVTFTPTDSTDYTTATANVTLTVNTLPNTITWATPAAIAYGTALSAAQLDATSTVPGTFAYTPAAGTVLRAGSQTLSVTFTPTDSTDYSTATATVPLTVNAATPAITWTTPAAINYGTALTATQLNATSTVAGTFSYSPAAGTVLKAGAQTLSVTFTPTDSTDYGTATATVTLTVKQATPAISWTAPSAIAYGTALSATQLDASSTVAGTFTYTPAAGTVLKAGAQTLSVTFTPTDSTGYSTATGAVTLTVKQSTPIISWTAPSAIAYGTALSAAQLDATSSVAGTFAYAPAAGTVLKAGLQSLSVTFTPTDSTDYSTATATVTLTVNVSAPTISWTTPAAINYGTALSATQLDASSTVAGTFTYTPAAGIVLKAGAQTLSVTFTPTDSTDYTTATANVTLTVNILPNTITWATPAAITYGTALSATQLDASSTVAGTFSYSPAAGTVLKAGAQTLSVTFTPTDSTDYSTATATVTLTVKQATPTISWTAPSAIAYGTALSATQLNATSIVAGTFAYTPAAGTVLKAGAQTLSVTFTPTDTTDYNARTATVTLTVKQATPTITWTAPAAITYGAALTATQLNATSTVPGTFTYTPAGGTVLKAGSQILSVTFTPTDSTDYSTATAAVSITVNAATSNISWAAPAAINYGTALTAAQLNATSTVAGTFSYSPAAGTVLKAGSQILSVTFTPTDSTDYSTATATVTLTVKQATPAITWTAPSAIAYGTALSATQLDATSTVPGTFAYTPAVGTVLKAGSPTLSVTFTPTDSTDYSTATAAVSITVNAATSTISWTAPPAIAYGAALTGTQLNATSTVAGTFSYSPAAGTVLKAGAQTLSVTFTPTDSTDYSTATATVTLTVKQATPAITWTAPSAIAYGTALTATQLNATSTVAGTFAYTPAAGTVLKAGSQTLSITFTPTDSTDYNTATANVTLTVNAATPTISWTAPAAIAYGTALGATQLDASSTLAGTFSYSPAAGTVLKAGAQTLSVTFTPTDTTDYSTATATVTLTVKQATPTITWATPAPIFSGTALSNTQLDASSTIPGTFVYSPAAGAVLAVGTQTLSVTFTPTDTTDYATATQTAILTVNAGTSTLSINASSVGFGNVGLNTLATQTVTLTSTGTASVTVNSATVTGTGFSLAGSTFSATLTPGQTATLGVQFDPTAAGAVTGSLTIISTSSGNGTVVIPLTGTGTTSPYAVDLTWDAPTSSTDPIAGYNVYRAPSGSSMYQLLNSSVDTQTTYTDSTVQSGQSYDYIVESVDDSGVASAPTSPIAVTIP